MAEACVIEWLLEELARATDGSPVGFAAANLRTAHDAIEDDDEWWNGAGMLLGGSVGAYGELGPAMRIALQGVTDWLVALDAACAETESDGGAAAVTTDTLTRLEDAYGELGWALAELRREGAGRD